MAKSLICGCGALSCAPLFVSVCCKVSRKPAKGLFCVPNDHVSLIKTHKGIVGSRKKVELSMQMHDD